ncbi:MAG: adenylyltransferase/cytidyltransferase family protein [Campylobacteraceae bacterium]|jgi:[citrate (pro-3S)-lyase] ligase|nr:adenylyltransferase/cytidyltransferase family protein [Campylobacteraceae bacterium]
MFLRLRNNSIKVVSKKTKEYSEDIFGVSYGVFVLNNTINIKLNVKNAKDLLFEYRLYDINLLIDKITYSKNKTANFTLEKFGQLRIRVFVKKEGSKKEDYSFLTEDICYDVDTAYRYLDNKQKDYDEAVLQISDMVEAKNKYLVKVDTIMRKLYAISFMGYNIAEYFKEQGISSISLFGHQNDMELTRFIHSSIKYAKNFNIKYYLSNSAYKYDILMPRKVTIEHKKLDKTTTFKRNDVILVCTSNKDKEVLENIADQTKAKVFHLLDIISKAYDTQFFIEPLMKIKNENPDIPIIILSTPVIKKVKNKSKNESNIVNKTVDIKGVRKNINSNTPAIPLSLSRFNNTLEYNREILRPFYLTKTAANIQTPVNYEGKHVNVINSFRLTVDQPDNYTNVIYVFGHSAVYGLGSSDEDTIPSNLQKLINKYTDKNRSYCVVNYANHAGADFGYQIDLMKNTIFKTGDIIISTISASAIDIAKKHFIVCEIQQAFERPHDMGEVFIDNIHMNKIGNQKVAKLLFQTILDNKLFDEKPKDVNAERKTVETAKPASRLTMTQSGGASAHGDKGRASIPKEESEHLLKYKELLLKHKSETKGNVGAIVMNCNPFTLGHHYLIEQSVKKVDHLYIFVVEEDKSYFPFKDRLELVKNGVADFKNVTVIPSGRFIISSLTFEAYSNKEKLQEEIIDASNDVTIFAEEIAPTLNITKRFAGEEPLDNVTRQYNNTMKMILPRYSIEFEVIERKSSDDEPISASKVRKLLENKNFDEIQNIVPQTTFEYLVKRFG